MAKKKTQVSDGQPVVGDVPVATPVAPENPVAIPLTEIPTPDPSAPDGTEPSAEHQNGDGPAMVFSVPVAKDTFVQASIWERTVNLRDNSQFVTHEVTVRKRWKSANGEWKSLHSFRASELYALDHVIARAEKWILDMRTVAKDCPF